MGSCAHTSPEPGLDFAANWAENRHMEIPGRVHNGVVVLEGGLTLPEGAAVMVLCPSPPDSQSLHEQKRVHLPLVPSEKPGSRQLTAQRIAEFLE